MVMSDQEIRQMKNKATEDVKKVLEELEHDYPGVTEGAASLIGAGAGAVGSLGALTLLGTTGLSAAGITSGLATAGGGCRWWHGSWNRCACSSYCGSGCSLLSSGKKTKKC